MTKVTGKDIDIELIPRRYKERVKRFSESANKEQKVIVPNGVQVWAIYYGLMRHIQAMNLQDKIKVRVVKCKSVYMYKVPTNQIAI